VAEGGAFRSHSRVKVEDRQTTEDAGGLLHSSLTLCWPAPPPTRFFAITRARAWIKRTPRRAPSPPLVQAQVCEGTGGGPGRGGGSQGRARHDVQDRRVDHRAIAVPRRRGSGRGSGSQQHGQPRLGRVLARGGLDRAACVHRAQDQHELPPRQHRHQGRRPQGGPLALGGGEAQFPQHVPRPTHQGQRQQQEQQQQVCVFGIWCDMCRPCGRWWRKVLCRPWPRRGNVPRWLLMIFTVSIFAMPTGRESQT